MTLEAAFSEIGKAAKVGESRPAAIQWLLNLTEDWLLILDNADDTELDLSPYLPKTSHAKIIITSRNKDVLDHVHPSNRFEFSDLSPEDALNLLLLRIGRGSTPQLVEEAE